MGPNVQKRKGKGAIFPSQGLGAKCRLEAVKTRWPRKTSRSRVKWVGAGANEGGRAGGGGKGGRGGRKKEGMEGTRGCREKVKTRTERIEIADSFQNTGL